MTTLSLEGLRVTYNHSELAVLDIPFAEFRDGLSFIAGANGSGKTTLLRAIGRLSEEVKVQGRIRLDGMDLGGVRIGMVDQNASKSIVPELTFVQNIILSTLSGNDFLKLERLEGPKDLLFSKEFLARFAANEVSEAILTTPGSSLSNGQQQLLAILMRLTRFPKVLLLDECTANLDEVNTNLIMKILEAVARQGTIVLFATHSEELMMTSGATTFRIAGRTLSPSAGA